MGRLVDSTKGFFTYAFAGLLFVFVSGLVLIGLGMMFGVDAEGSTLGLATITELVSAIVNLEPIGIIIGLIFFLLLGALIWIFGIVGVMIRKMVGLKEDEKASFDKRPALLGFFIVGIIAVVIFAGLSAIVAGVTDDTIDITNAMTLFDAIAQGNPLTFLGALIGLSLIGFLVVKIAKIEKTTSDNVVPEQAKFGES